MIFCIKNIGSFKNSVMMKDTIYLFLFTLVFFQSCDENIHLIKHLEEPIPSCENCSFTCLDTTNTNVITNDCIDNWECIFEVLPQSMIDLSEDEVIKNGNKNVFRMTNSTQGSQAIADDEFTNILIFELDATQNSFSVEDNELENMQVAFSRLCYCTETEFKTITSGCLQGEKQSDDTWFIQGNLIVPYSFGNIDVKFEAQFVD